MTIPNAPNRRYKALPQPSNKLSYTALAALLVAVGTLSFLTGRSLARGPETDVKLLLKTETTILSQPISYPNNGTPDITAVIVTMHPGEQTGWHKHAVPMFGMILEGEVTVDYGTRGTHVYRKGDTLIEAIEVPHDGHNTGQKPARILAVFMGANGSPNTTMLPAH